MAEIKEISHTDEDFQNELDTYVKANFDGSTQVPKPVAQRLIGLFGAVPSTGASTRTIEAFVNRASTGTYVSTTTIVDYFREQPATNWGELSSILARLKTHLRLQVAGGATSGHGEDTQSEGKAETDIDTADSGERLQHIVLFTFRPDATEAELSHVAKSVFRLTVIPGVIDVKFGPVKTGLYADMSDRSNGFTHVLQVVVKGANALEVYDKHPIHVAVRDEVLKPMAIRPAVAVDYFPLF